MSGSRIFVISALQVNHIFFGKISFCFDYSGKREESNIVMLCPESGIRLEFDERTQTLQNVQVYIDADNPTLIKRFSETRRKHPLSNNDTSLKEAIESESKILDAIAAMADLSIDTSKMNLHELR